LGQISQKEMFTSQILERVAQKKQTSGKFLDVANLECLGLENVNIHKYSLGMTNIHR
jgi:hypothetical protein